MSCRDVFSTYHELHLPIVEAGASLSPVSEHCELNLLALILREGGREGGRREGGRNEKGEGQGRHAYIVLDAMYIVTYTLVYRTSPYSECKA